MNFRVKRLGLLEEVIIIWGVIWPEKKEENSSTSSSARTSSSEGLTIVSSNSLVLSNVF